MRPPHPRPAPVFAALAVVGAVSACYHAQPLNVGELFADLNDLRRTDPVFPAPTTEPAAGTISEERAVAIAMLWNRDLRAFRLARGVAEGEVTSANELANPVLRVNLVNVQNLPRAAGVETRLSWTPPQPGVRAGRKEAARAHVEEVVRELAEREWALACDVRIAHATLLALDENIRIAETTVANRRRLVELVDKRVAQGGTTRFDLDLARLSLAGAERAASERRLAHTVAASALVRLLGVGPPASGIAVAGVLGDDAVEGALPAQNDLEERAVLTRPALAVARAHYEVIEQTLRSETAARWPWFTLSAIPQLRRDRLTTAATEVAIGLDLTLPLLNTNQGRVQSATAARNEARAEVIGWLANLRAEIAQARAAIEAQRAYLARVHAEIEPVLAEHDRLLAQAALAAEVDLPALIAAEDLVLAARTELTDARLELRKARVALERALGTNLGNVTDGSNHGRPPP